MTPSDGLELADPDDPRWLRDLDPDPDPEAWVSFMPHLWPAETWVLHGMWEAPGAAPSDVLAVERLPRGGLFATEVIGFPSSPPGWTRLWWRDLAARLGEPLAVTASTQPVPPCFRWFSLGPWPDWITQPAEGTLDQPTADRLLSVLARFTPGGADGSCFVYYSGAGWPFGEWAPLTFRGPLRKVFDLARYSSRETVTPDNIWPSDRSWLLTTDYDLWATRLAGPAALIAAIEADQELETTRFGRRPESKAIEE